MNMGKCKRFTGERKSVVFSLLMCMAICITVMAKPIRAEETDVKEYSIDSAGVTVAIPSDWPVMYEGSPGLDETYQSYGFTSYDAWKEYMDSSNCIFETLNKPNLDLNNYENIFSDKEVIDIYLMEDTQTLAPNIDNLAEASEDEKSTYADEARVKYKNASGMTLVDGDYIVGDHMDFVTMGLTVSNFHYYIATTVVAGEAYSLMAVSDVDDAVVEGKKDIVDTMVQTLSINPSAIVAEDTNDSISSDAQASTDSDAQTAADTNATTSIDSQVAQTSNTIFRTAAIPASVFIVIVLMVLLYGFKCKKSGEFHEDALSLEVSKGLQGFCAIGIMLHHMAQTLTNNGNVDKGLLNQCNNIGVFFVGMFFFFSGYGLYKSLKTKQDYMKGFLRNRIPTILVPFYTANTIFIVTMILTGVKFSNTDLIKALTGWLLINTQLWYIVEIFLLYLLFYIAYRVIRKENIAYIFLFISIVGMIVGSLYLGHDYRTISGGAWFKGEWWYNATFLFFVGITFARFGGKLKNLVRKYYYVFLGIGLAGSVILTKVTNHMLETKGYWFETETYRGYKEKFQTLLCQLPMIIFLVGTFLLITYKVQFKNKALDFLGKIALELYIIHNLFITFLRDGVGSKNDFLFIATVYILSICLATVLHVFDQKLIHLFKGRSRRNIRKIEQKEHTQKESGNKGDRQHLIDCMRLFMAFLVVCIHAPLPGKAGELFFVVGKVAVPFFLVVCGYFCYRDSKEEFLVRLTRQAKRMFLLCVTANFLYFYLHLFMQFKAGNVVNIASLMTPSAIRNLFLYNMSPVADHLWFLGSLLYAIVFMIVITKLDIESKIMNLAPLLLIIYVYLSTKGTGDYFVYRNCILVGFGYFAMGCLLRSHQDSIRKTFQPIWIDLTALVCFILVFVEYNQRKTLSVPYLSIEILVYLIVLVGINHARIGKGTIIEWLGSKCTLFVYIAHMFVLWYIWEGVSRSHTNIQKYAAIIAFLVSLVIAAIYQGIKQVLREKSNKVNS